MRHPKESIFPRIGIRKKTIFLELGKKIPICFPKKEEVKSIGNPAGIGKGTGFGLREWDRDGIGLGHYRLRAR